MDLIEKNLKIKYLNKRKIWYFYDEIIVIVINKFDISVSLHKIDVIQKDEIENIH